jgi:hypothetical protein
MHFHLTIALFLTVATAYGADIPAKSAPPRPVKSTITNEAYIQFRSEAKELLDAIYRKKPEMFGNLKLRRQREKLLNRIVAATVPDIKYYGRFSTIPAKPSGKVIKKTKIEVFKPLKLPGSKVYYCRIDTLEPDNVSGATKDESCPMIIDLRSCSGGNWKTAEILLKNISENSILLIGPKTTGPAEAVAAKAIKSGGITMGAKTAGRPFPEERFQLKDGTLLIFPRRPKTFESVPPHAVTPVIPEKIVPRVHYKKLEQKQDTGNDRCLNRASDLIKVMNLIKTDKKKQK